MIIKQHPDDFFVEELADLQPGEDGPFSLYRLEKRGWTTPDALQAVRRRWQIDLNRMSYGGLKDRHAHTLQYLSIFRGPRRKLTHQGIAVEYLGQVAEPFTSQHIQANRFRLVLRDFSDAAIARAKLALEELRETGVPNYFDDQRFGSVTVNRDFLAKALILGQYDQALRMALTSPYTHDRAAMKKEKSILRLHWGDWARCKELLERGHARSLIDYMVHHPDDFRGAVARLRPELRGLYLSAYQSHLWNRMLASWLKAHVPLDRLVSVKLRLGDCPMPKRLDPAAKDELASLNLPLPSSRVAFTDDDPRRPCFDEVLAEEGLQIEQFKLKGLRDMYFSRGERPALCMPANLRQESANDEEHKGKKKLTLSFELPRGMYATLLVKRITGNYGSD